MEQCPRCNGSGVEYYYDSPMPCSMCSADKVNRFAKNEWPRKPSVSEAIRRSKDDHPWHDNPDYEAFFKD